jgi:hypothetical protein
MSAAFVPALPNASRAATTIVLLVAAAADGNTTFTLPSGWQRAADVTDGNPVGLDLYFYPNAPSGAAFGAFTLSAAGNLSYTMTEIGANLALACACRLDQGHHRDLPGELSSGAHANTHAYANTHAHANPDANPDSHTDTHADADTCPHAHAHADTGPNAHAFADSAAGIDLRRRAEQ